MLKSLLFYFFGGQKKQSVPQTKVRPFGELYHEMIQDCRWHPVEDCKKKYTAEEIDHILDKVLVTAEHVDDPEDRQVFQGDLVECVGGDKYEWSHRCPYRVVAWAHMPDPYTDPSNR